MYDLSQLNDLLVPELLDIAAQQKIITSKKQSREELITLILEKQDHMAQEKKITPDEKPKRKRIIKVCQTRVINTR